MLKKDLGFKAEFLKGETRMLLGGIFYFLKMIK